jgi:hypothetical protein
MGTASYGQGTRPHPADSAEASVFFSLVMGFTALITGIAAPLVARFCKHHGTIAKRVQNKNGRDEVPAVISPLPTPALRRMPGG